MRELIIRTEKLTKYFGSSRAIEDLNLDIEPGEVFGLLGPAGAGKTTLTRMFVDLIHPTRGDVYLFGVDLRKNNRPTRRRIGYASSSLPLYLNFSAKQFFKYLSYMHAPVDWSYVQDLALRFQLDLKQSLHSFSQSERIRLNIIQAFMHHPDLLILDEPLTGLDQPSLNTVFQLIGEARAEGRTVFLATSNQHEIERVCDRVGILSKGKLLCIERVVQFKSRLLRKVEIRFAEQISPDLFKAIPNLQDLSIERLALSCTVKGDPDGLIKAAGQYRITDLISNEMNVDDVIRAYFGESTYAA